MNKKHERTSLKKQEEYEGKVLSQAKRKQFWKVIFMHHLTKP